jgi:hypothetical protein
LASSQNDDRAHVDSALEDRSTSQSGGTDAHRADIDTHLLERLIRRGCSPYLALEIAR